MPGGLLSLVCYGNENVILNGNPQVTWFYKTFLRHTHFSQEPIQIPLEGPNLLQMDNPILIKAKIPRQGDLLSDLVLRVQVPDIFSKAYISEDLSGYVLDRKYEFAWVRQVGVRMIQSVTFTIGGQKIQEFTSDWISARAALDLNSTQYAKWRYMVGDTPEMFDPANGVYGDPGVPGGYPNVMAWRGSQILPVPVQNNAPSIPGRILRVPLGLWFSDYIENSLPLVGLQYHDCEIQILLRPIKELYTVLDTNGNRVRPGVQTLPYIASDQYPTIWNSTFYGPLPSSLNNLYGAADMSGVRMKDFLTDISGAVPFQEGWPLNASLEATYTFVTSEEQRIFATKTLRYNVRQVQNFIYTGVTNRDLYELDVHNIATRIVYFGRRSDAIPYRNQALNLTNWMYPTKTQRPFVSPYLNLCDPSGVNCVTIPLIPQEVYSNGKLIQIGYSGLNLPGLQRRILRNMNLKANGQQLFDAQDSAYFTEYVPYRYLQGSAAPYADYGLATQTEMWPLYTYSFSLNGSSVEQPKGTLNTSRIDSLEIDIDVEPIPYLANYTYEISIYVETLNFLEISSGMGGLKFAK
jgi:hypothetical protein